MFGFQEEIRAIVIGGSGGLGQQFVQQLCASSLCTSVWSTYRNNSPTFSNPKLTWNSLDITDENSIQEWTNQMKESGFSPNFVLNCCGVLHTEQGIQPEKTWRHLNLEQMQQVFAINAFGPALLSKHIIPLMPRTNRAIFASVSARVGSISDNHIGGWYSYRASKAAHNMLIKTISIEAQRKRKELICVSLHPGTVDTALSQPYTKRYDPKKLFTPQQSCDYLSAVLQQLSPTDTGSFFAWDGQPILF